MQLAHPRRRSGGRRRSSGRSRSRSPASRRRHNHRHHRHEHRCSRRSRHKKRGSRERYRVTPPPPAHRDRESDRYQRMLPDPSVLSSKLSPEEQSMKSDRSRLRKPEIQSTSMYDADPQLAELGRFSSTHVNPAPITLTERFTRLTAVGTAVYNKRYSGRSSDSRLPQLIITNNAQLPAATLIRQAKSISIVVTRKFPDDHKHFSQENGSGTSLRIPRRISEGFKPVFDRPEMKFYQTTAEEAEVAKRLLDCISASKPEKTTWGDSRTYDDTRVAVTGRFFGSRVDNTAVGTRQTHPIDPSDTPRNPAYFMHDTRDDNDLTSRRNWRTRFPNATAGYRRDFRDRRSPGRSPVTRDHQSPFRSNRREQEDRDRWQHDKFEQLEREQGSQHNRSDSRASGGSGEATKYKPVPRPIPAPKTILWSTIGKESLTNESNAQLDAPMPDESHGEPYRDSEPLRSSTTHTMNGTDVVRVDMEPVLDVTVDDS